MHQVFIVLPVTIAFGTVDSEYVLEQEAHDAVRLLHVDLLMALGARDEQVLQVVCREILVLVSEADEAVFAGAGRAARALNDFRDHRHADGALEVLGLDS